MPGVTVLCACIRTPHTASSCQPSRTYAATGRCDAMLGMCSGIWAWGMSLPSREAVKAVLQHTAAGHCCRSQPRHRQGILIARDGRHGVYARCISRVCGTVAAKQVPQSSVHLQPTHQDSLTRRCHRKTLSLTCLVGSGPGGAERGKNGERAQ